MDNQHQNIYFELFDFINQSGYPYCIVGGFDDFTFNRDGDIDIVIDYPDMNQGCHKLIYDYCKKRNLQLVQYLKHETIANYYIIWIRTSDTKENIFLKLDICSDYICNGRKYFSVEKILHSRIQVNDKNGSNIHYYIPSPENEFIYYLIKKIEKQQLSNAHKEHLSSVWNDAPEQAIKEVKRFWKEKEVNMIAKAAKTGNWDHVQKNIIDLQKSLHKSTRRFSFRWYFSEFKRFLKRIAYPTGIHIVFLGADGSGKSTVIDKVIKEITQAFRLNTYFHLFPFYQSNGNPVTNPHSLKPRNIIGSIVKIMIWYYRFTIGWIFQIHPRKIRSTLICFDRYYHDILVDPIRYRYGAPRWIASIVGALIVKPDLWILLDAPAEILQSRKQEVPLDESNRQRNDYLKLVKGFNNSLIVDATMPIEDVVENINKFVLSYMENRTKQRID